MWARLQAKRADLQQREAEEAIEARFKAEIARLHEQVKLGDGGQGQTARVLQHRLAIADEILTHKCPSCCAAFFDWTGCSAVTCSTCRSMFCGLCFQPCASSSACHSHVRACGLNPDKGELFTPATVLRQVHGKMRAAKLQEYG